MPTCEVCNSPDAAIVSNLLGPQRATLCSPCFRAWAEYLLANYDALTVHRRLVEFRISRLNYPSTTGLMENEEDVAREFHDLDRELYKIWNNWFLERRRKG